MAHESQILALTIQRELWPVFHLILSSRSLVDDLHRGFYPHEFNKQMFPDEMRSLRRQEEKAIHI